MAFSLHCSNETQHPFLSVILCMFLSFSNWGLIRFSFSLVFSNLSSNVFRFVFFFFFNLDGSEFDFLPKIASYLSNLKTSPFQIFLHFHFRLWLCIPVQVIFVFFSLIKHTYTATLNHYSAHICQSIISISTDLSGCVLQMF